MKKLLLSAVAGALAFGASAQDERFAPSILVYADLSYIMSVPADNTIGSTNRTINWHAYPGIGYQFSPNWVVGANLGWSQDATRIHTGASKDSSTTANNYQVGPFVRYTNAIANSKIFYWFTQLNLYYQGGYSTSESIPSYDKHHGFGATLIPALGMDLGHKWCLNFSIGGVGYVTDKPNAINGVSFGSDKNFSFTLGQTYSIGVSKNFGGHHMMHMKHHHDDMGEDTRMPDTSNDSDNGGTKKKDDE